MKGPLFAMMFLTLLIGFFPAAATAQQQGKGPAGMPRYNVQTEMTVSGTITEVKQIPGGRRGSGTHLMVQAGDKTWDVHAGPSWYLTQNKYEFAKGDQVEITGSKVTYQGSDALIAREIKKAGAVITLRDAQGIPKWSRARGGRP